MSLAFPHQPYLHDLRTDVSFAACALSTMYLLRCQRQTGRSRFSATPRWGTPVRPCVSWSRPKAVATPELIACVVFAVGADDSDARHATSATAQGACGVTHPRSHVRRKTSTRKAATSSSPSRREPPNASTGSFRNAVRFSVNVRELTRRPPQFHQQEPCFRIRCDAHLQLDRPVNTTNTGTHCSLL